MICYSRYHTVLFVLMAILSGCRQGEEQITPELASITESVYASVIIEPADKYQVYANTQGVLRNLYVDEGELVKDDQRLAQIEATQVEANVDNARISLQLARDKLTGDGSLIREIELEIEAVREELSVDSINYERQKTLWDKKIGSKAELDNRRLKYELTKKRLDGLTERLKQTRNELEKSIDRSENSLRSARANAGDYLLKARMAGKVYELFLEEGELVSPQQPIATLGASDDYILEMQIDEVDIIRVLDSMRIIVSLDAYGDRTFEAVVTHIYPTKDPKTQTFEVEGRFVEKPERLYAGLSGEANIVIAKREEALTIPLTYVYDDNKVKTPDGEVEVVLGVRDLERVEVLSGLDRQTKLIKP